ncbi:MAG: hypothetical protein OEX00_11065, partial [Gammaproteobacteria bacterium]|nr:hypothetical protein [Gammaproteobacteria bacterium]
FGVISVYDLPGANLSKQCQALGLHTVNVHTAHPMIECEAWYPHLLEDSPSASPKYQQEASDLFSLLVNPQVEPSLKPALGANSEQRIFFFGKLAPTAVQSLLSLWQDSRSWRKDYLCVSTDESFGQGSATFKSVISCSGLPYQYLSTWNRSPLPPETLLIADQPRWVSALASAADQTVISGKNPLEFWQVLAAGGTLRLTSTGEKWSKLLKNMGNYSFSWESWLAQNSNHISPMDRKTQDAQRQVFWQYRRAAQAVLDELLQRVFDW